MGWTSEISRIDIGKQFDQETKIVVGILILIGRRVAIAVIGIAAVRIVSGPEIL